MYNRISMCLTTVTKLCPNAFIHSFKNNTSTPTVKIAVQLNALKVRGYSDKQVNPSSILHDQYNKKYEEELAKLLEDPESRAVYDRCKLEVEFLGYETHRKPEKLTAFNWIYLMRAKTKSQRRTYIEHLWKVERKVEHRLRKKELKDSENKMEEEEDDDSPYGLSKCTMFHRIRNKTIIEFHNSRLINAMLHEPTVVFDLGYEEYMAPYEAANCAKQLLLSFSQNRLHDSPFNLQFCNVNKDGFVMERLHKSIPQLYDPEFPLNITSKSYLDVFPKEKLVYLTPHTNKIMRKYDPNLIYIIGAMVDKVNPAPISFQKANREGIRMMRFPLEDELEWGTGSKKNLPLNHVLSILLDLRLTNDWGIALERNIPKRKLRESREHNIQKMIMKRQKRLDALGKK